MQRTTITTAAWRSRSGAALIALQRNAQEPSPPLRAICRI
jgi:hypothetical protein